MKVLGKIEVNIEYNEQKEVLPFLLLLKELISVY